MSLQRSSSDDLLTEQDKTVSTTWETKRVKLYSLTRIEEQKLAFCFVPSEPFVSRDDDDDRHPNDYKSAWSLSVSIIKPSSFDSQHLTHLLLSLWKDKTIIGSAWEWIACFTRLSSCSPWHLLRDFLLLILSSILSIFIQCYIRSLWMTYTHTRLLLILWVLYCYDHDYDHTQYPSRQVSLYILSNLILHRLLCLHVSLCFQCCLPPPLSSCSSSKMTWGERLWRLNPSILSITHIILWRWCSLCSPFYPFVSILPFFSVIIPWIPFWFIIEIHAKSTNSFIPLSPFTLKINSELSWKREFPSLNNRRECTRNFGWNRISLGAPTKKTMMTPLMRREDLESLEMIQD